MRTARRFLSVLAVAGLATFGVPAAAMAEVGTQDTGMRLQAAAASAWQGKCAKGDVCVWSGRNGTGTRCAWNGNDPDWQGGAVQCRPHGFKVQSVWNNGYQGKYDTVWFYQKANYRQGIYDPLPPSSSGHNIKPTTMRSHQWK
ncbi:hypothetical protein CDO52_18015 [Nocardiopsis gilva YIM 90087]|uniref:Peptidase inhibitor family I36 n=1 Tax=Nocardiopsis gilva YIM 90087 TaxID=1235441 RepID=A0A223S8N4_9ACTN|nr:peptidase inhibitor family I36 protein [Nocardiopsis gilva]ASU84442.1 hypothetical protein CDO52_18015 [Nocardiopsis gilva YIM 90087]